MIEDGAHMFFLQQQLGHASIVTTQRYAHLYPSQGIALRDRMDDRFSKLSGAGVGLRQSKLVSIAG
jgi:site-specific recombinase XerD